MKIKELLLKERQELVDRLAQIDKMLGQYDELERAAQALITGSTRPAISIDSHDQRTEEKTPGEDQAPDTRHPDTEARSRLKTPTDEFERAVIDILREADAPMDRTELYDALTERGVVIGGGDKGKELNALSARIYRMAKAGHLEGKRGSGYRLKHPEELNGSTIRSSEPTSSGNEHPSDDDDYQDLLE